MALTSLEEYLPVLSQRDEHGEPYVLVGGQAVNFWARNYQPRESRLDEFDPFLSRDLDLLATAAQGQRIAAATGWEFVPPEPEAVNVQGRLRLGQLEVELLTAQGRPLLPLERGQLSPSVGASTAALKLISPDVLLVSKAALAVMVPQDGSIPDIAVRQDMRHVKMLALIVPHYLADLMARYPDKPAQMAAIQPSLAILASVRRGLTGRRFEETHPGVLRWGELLPPSVRALPLDAVYRRCLKQLDAQ